MKRPLACACALLLAACGGGSGGSGGSSAIPGPVGASGTVALHLAVPARASDGRARVSAGAQGVGVVVYFHSDAAHATPVGSAAFDVSASSALCMTTAQGRSCTLQFPAPVPAAGDSDDVVITTYSQPPSGGAFAPGTLQLDTGVLNVAPIAGQMISPAVTLGGIPATVTIAIDNPFASYDANLYAGLSYNLEVVAQDASGETIIGSDPYGAPIALSTSLGGLSVSARGRRPASFRRDAPSAVSVTSPNQTVTFIAPISAASISIASASPAATATATVESRGAGSAISSGGLPLQIAQGNDRFVYAVDSSTVYTIVPPTNAVSSLAANPGYAFQGIATAAPGSGGAVIISENNGTNEAYSLAIKGGGVVDTPASFPGNATFVGLPLLVDGGPVYFVGNGGTCDSTTCIGAAGAQGTVGPDGNLWIAQGGAVAIVAPGPPPSAVTTVTLPSGASAISIANGPDGNVYVLDAGNKAIERITPSHVVTEYPAGGAVSGNIIAGPDDAMWYCVGTQVGRFDLSSLTAASPITPQASASATVYWLALGPDGALWAVDSAGNFDRIIP